MNTERLRSLANMHKAIGDNDGWSQEDATYEFIALALEAADALDAQQGGVGADLIVDEPDEYGNVRIWPFGREPHLASVDVRSAFEDTPVTIFFRGYPMKVEDTRRYACALLKACEIADEQQRTQGKEG